MTPDRAQQLVVGCLTASTAVAAGSSLASGSIPPFRLVIGVAFTGIGLATMSMFAPDLAGMFATLVLTGTVFYFGGPLLEAITRDTAAPPAAQQNSSSKTTKGTVAV